MKMDLSIIGTRVKYVRVDAAGALVESEGEIFGVVLSHDRRLQVRIHDGDKQYNIDMPAIMPTEEEKVKYLEHVERVRAHADAANAHNKKLVQAANDEIAVMNDEYFGTPIPAPIETPASNDNEGG